MTTPTFRDATPQPTPRGPPRERGRRRGKARAILQVISANTTARSFYQSLGYAEHDHRLGPVARRFGYSSVMMRKALAPVDYHDPG